MAQQYISLQRIFAKINRTLRNRTINESDIIEWSGEALEAIGSKIVFQPAVKIQLVENYQTSMPNFLHALIQIARNNNWVDEEEIITEEQEISSSSTLDVPVAIDANGMPVNAYDLAYYRPFNDFDGESFIIGGLQIKRYQFTPVRLANHSFFNSLVCKESDFDGIYRTCNDEYTIIENLFRFSFETGQVMISYLKQKLDENGYPMIPDTIANTTAIEKYILMKLMEQDFYDGREGSEKRYAKAESDWQWYCRQAKNEDIMPQTVDEMQNILDWKNHLIPKTKRYYGFFGALSHPQMLKF
jgi:hypothetical protein